MDALISLFIVPTLAGYIFLTKSEIRSVRVSYFSIARIAVESLIAGIVFLYISYIIFGAYRLSIGNWPSTGLCILDSSLLFIQNTASKINLEIKTIWAFALHPLITEIQYQNALISNKHPISNQSISTIGVALAFLAYEWVYKKRKPSEHKVRIAKERTKIGGQLEEVLNHASDTQEPIQLSMRCGKVYVGLVKTLPPINLNSEHHNFLRIIPLYSGYRDKETQEVIFKTDYTEPLRKMVEEAGTSDEDVKQVSEVLFGGLNIDLNDVTVASIWSRELYERFKIKLEKLSPNHPPHKTNAQTQ